MYKVFEADKDVSSEHNPKNNRWIQFNSDGDPFGHNTGTWSINNQKFILFIDSKVDDDDSEWNISFKDDLTTFEQELKP